MYDTSSGVVVVVGKFGTIDGKRHQVDRSIRSGSWFEGSNITMEETIKMAYTWSQKNTFCNVR